MLILTISGDASPLRAKLSRDLTERSLADVAESWGPFIVGRQSTDVVCAGPDGRLISSHETVQDRSASRTLGPDQIGALLYANGDLGLATLAPPFRFAWTLADETEISIAADHVGLAHVYGWQGEGVACVSDSATAIGRLFGLPVDMPAMAGWASIGSFVGQDSAVHGVRKLLPGHKFTLADGRLMEVPMSQPAALLEGLADAHAIREVVMRQSAAFPDAFIEVSGGFDSRLIVAALTPERRSHHRGFTIGPEGDPDVVLARKICSMNGMEHTVVDPGQIRSLDRDEFTRLLQDACISCDFASNPLDRLAINVVNQRFPTGPRFSGQNGEYLRGFYYPGQPLGAPINAGVAKSVISWRLMTNDSADPQLFESSWFAAQRDVVVRRLSETLVSYSGICSSALDRFYLEQRMQRWCGAGVSAVLGTRQVLLPFFDEDALALGRRTPYAEKAASRFAGRLIVELDAKLGELPLEKGISPRDVAAGGIVARTSEASHFARSIADKIGRKLLQRDRETLGSADSAQLYYQHGLPQTYPVEAVESLGVFNGKALRSFAAGQWKPTRSGLGLLINLGCLTQLLAGS